MNQIIALISGGLLAAGSGDASSNNLIISNKQTAAVGDTSRVTGKLALNCDFGMGYHYPC